MGRLLGDGEEVGEMDYYHGIEKLELVDTTPHTYTVVGFYDELNSFATLDKRAALTKGEGTGDWSVFFTLKDPGGIYTWLANAPYGRNYDYHGNLLRYYGAFRSNTIVTALYGFAAVLVFLISSGFITLISLTAAANVFNTISTNVSLRRREFAMLRSVGLSERGLRKMMSCECVIYGLRGLLWGLPASAVMTWVIYRVASSVLTVGFYIPWYSVAIAVGSVFAVVFATMLYAVRKLRRDALVETLKSESF